MKKALEALFKQYYQDVYRYLYSLCRDPALAEELAAEVFLEIVRSFRSFRGASDVRTWLFSVARHRWFAWLRKQGREVPAQELREDLISMERSLEQQYTHRETARRALELLGQEPERNRTIVLMRAEGYSFHEIGKAAGVSESTARVMDHRTRKKIRQILETEGYGDV